MPYLISDTIRGYSHEQVLPISQQKYYFTLWRVCSILCYINGAPLAFTAWGGYYKNPQALSLALPSALFTQRCANRMKTLLQEPTLPKPKR